MYALGREKTYDLFRYVVYQRFHLQRWERKNGVHKMYFYITVNAFYQPLSLSHPLFTIYLPKVLFQTRNRT